MTTGSFNSGESTADRLIREAMEAGEFDDLPGSGRPIPGLGKPDDDGWWIREWVRRNRDDDDAYAVPGTPHSGTSGQLERT